jgi:hypothetical protein
VWFSFQPPLDPALKLKYSPASQPLLPDVPRIPGSTGYVVVRLSAKDPAGNEIKFSTSSGEASEIETDVLEFDLETRGLSIPLNDNALGDDDLQSRLESALTLSPPRHGGGAVDITGSVFVKFNEWPVEKLVNSIKIRLEPMKGCAGTDHSPIAPPMEPSPVPAAPSTPNGRWPPAVAPPAPSGLLPPPVAPPAPSGPLPPPVAPAAPSEQRPPMGATNPDRP